VGPTCHQLPSAVVSVLSWMERDARSSDPPRRNRALFPPSVIIPVLLGPLQDNLHRLVIVPLHFEVCCPAVTLGRGNVRMTQKVLDRGQVGVRVQKLGGEGMTEGVRVDGADAGTTGEAAAKNDRGFVLVDHNPDAAAIMAKRLAAYEPELVGFTDDSSDRSRRVHTRT